MLKKLKAKIEKIENNKMYSPQDVQELGVIVNTQLEPSVFTLYRLIKRGELPVVNLGSGGSPRYFVKGADLKKYVSAKLEVYKPTPKPEVVVEQPKAKRVIKKK